MRIIFALMASLGLINVQSQVGIEKHPLVIPYEGSVLSWSEALDYDSYQLINGFDFRARQPVSKTIEGRITRFYYRNPKERSELEILVNYREALDESGFKEVWSCAGDGECSTGSTRSSWFNYNGIRAINGGKSRYFAGHLTYEGKVAYVAVAVGRRGTSIDIIETTQMDRNKVEISAVSLATGLDIEGHTRVDGLLFAHNSDELLPESIVALEAVAQLLKERPGLLLYVVGHTDLTGTLEFNLDLSKRRANSVVRALIKDYAITNNRLEARGIGPLAPEVSNESADGRARNRRVEIVIR